MTLLLAGPACPAFLRGGGAMGARIRGHDWASTPLGPVGTWPLPLRSALAICLRSSFPTAIYWGRDLRLLYNDAWAPVPAEKHPWALGRPGAEVWSDIWHVVGPQFEHVMQSGEGVSSYDQLLPMQRGGMVEETWWNYSLTPILDEAGRVAGVFNQGNEITARVLEERRLAFRLELEDRLRELREPAAIRRTAADALARHLGATRAGIATVDEEGVARVGIDLRADGTEGLGGRFRLAGFGAEAAAVLRAGKVLAIEDVAEDPRCRGIAARAQHRALGQRAVIAAPLLRQGRLAGLVYASHAVPRRWTDSDRVLLREVAERAWSAIGRAEAETALAESEARFRTLADTAPALVWTADAEGLRTWLSAGWMLLTGQAEREALGFGWTAAVHPEDRPAVVAAWLAAVRDQDAFRMEYRLRAADGSYRWALDAATPRHGGEFGGFIGSVVDITERRQMEERHELLAREIEHRAKNTLAVVLAALRLTRADSLAEYRAALEGRVATLARAQALLGEDRWHAGIDLGTLLEGTLATFLGSGDVAPGLRSRLEGPPVALPSQVTQPLAMALHEMATNAVKHGALSVAGGEVTVTWSVEPAPVGEGRLLHLCWTEAGGPPVDHPPERRGFGTRVLDGTVRAQLGGTVQTEWREEGLVCRLTIPLGGAGT